MKREENPDMKAFSVMLGARLRTLRKRRALIQSQVSRLLDLDRSTYAYYERGKISVPIYYLNILSEYYHVPLNVLTGDDAAFEAFLTGGGE